MNPDSHDLIQRHMAGLLTDDEAAGLQTRLKSDAHLRRLYLHYMNLDVALEAQAGSRDRAIDLLRATPLTESKPAGRWYSWCPLTAAAAGIVFGMFCTSMVFGYAAFWAAVKKTPLRVFDPSFEDSKPLDTGLPHDVDQWGVRSARVVSAEYGVRPLHGEHMLCMEPVLMRDDDENHYSKLHQVIDLRSLHADALEGDMEVLVTASFCATEDVAKLRYHIRVIALNEPPALATKGLWSKAEEDGVVSLSRRFEPKTGDTGWQVFSAKMPLPRGAQSLVITLESAVPKDTASHESVRCYLDEVRAFILTCIPTP